MTGRVPIGALAYRQCVNPDCLAEEGDRHEADCTPEPGRVPSRSTEQDAATTDAATLSRIMFDAREQIDMWADVVEVQSGQPADHQRRLVAEIDAYRAVRGWSPHGFGGET